MSTQTLSEGCNGLIRAHVVHTNEGNNILTSKQSDPSIDFTEPLGRATLKHTVEMERKQHEEEHRGAEFESAFALRVHRAEEMLKAFASIGATVFDLTCTNIAGEKAVFRKNRPFPSLAAQLPVILQTADSRQWNVIVRPHPVPGRVVVQLDDLDREKLTHVEELAFLVIETSPGSFQAWVAVHQPESVSTQKYGDAEVQQSIIRRFRQGAGADIHASGATRICGSRNIKGKYKPDFPTVGLTAIALRRVVTESDVDLRGLLAPESTDHRPPFAPQRAKRARDFSTRVPPSYTRCLEDAPAARNHEGKDRSHADFEFALIAADRGFSPAETAELLMQVSEKAAGEGQRYAEFTAKRAANIVARRQLGK